MPAGALTADVTPEDWMRTLATGFRTHALQPVDPGELALATAPLAGLIRPPTP